MTWGVLCGTHLLGGAASEEKLNFDAGAALMGCSDAAAAADGGKDDEGADE